MVQTEFARIPLKIDVWLRKQQETYYNLIKKYNHWSSSAVTSPIFNSVKSFEAPVAAIVQTMIVQFEFRKNNSHLRPWCSDILNSSLYDYIAGLFQEKF